MKVEEREEIKGRRVKEIKKEEESERDKEVKRLER